MFIWYPNYLFKRIYNIDRDFFSSRGITTLLLDVDNTLTGDNDPMPNQQVLDWLDTQKENGLRLMIISNNYESRVAPFAQSLGLEYIAEAKKPLGKNIKKALDGLGVTVKETAIIGDQIFTDILAGRLSGCLAVMVEPFKIEGYGFYKVKRSMEAPILKRFEKKYKDLDKRG